MERLPVDEPVPSGRSVSVLGQSADGVPFREVRLPVDQIILSKDVPQFKEGGDPRTGETEPLGGRYDPFNTGPVVVWERVNGDMEVITGRHRLALSRRSGVKDIAAHVVREADGFTRTQAMVIDAESNIRDGQGKVADYANYFRHTEVTAEEASSRGLLARDKGRTGYAIGKYASDDLYAAYRSGILSEAKTAAIAEAAPNKPEVQAIGQKYAKTHKADEVAQYLRTIQALAPDADAKQLDMFGRDDAWMIKADKLAKAATAITRDLQEERKALRAARSISSEKRGKVLQKYGFKPGDVDRVEQRLTEINEQLYRWERWHTDPELTRQVEQRAGYAPREAVQAQPTQSLEDRKAAQGVQSRDQGEMFGRGAVGDVFELRPQTTQQVPRSAEQVRADEEAARRAERDQGKLFGAVRPPDAAADGPGGWRFPDWMKGRPTDARASKLWRLLRKDEKGERVGVRSIADYLVRAFDLEVRRSMHQTSGKHPAHYRPSAHAIFTRMESTSIMYHEAAHGMDYLIRRQNPAWLDQHRHELIALTRVKGSMASSETAREGVAEWVRNYIERPWVVDGMAFTRYAEQFLGEQHPRLLASLQDAARLHFSHKNRTEEAQLRSFMRDTSNIEPRASELSREAWSAVMTGVARGNPARMLERDLARTIRNNSATQREGKKLMRQWRQQAERDLVGSYELTLTVEGSVQSAFMGRGRGAGISILDPKTGAARQMTDRSFAAIRDAVGIKNWDRFEEAAWAKTQLDRWEKSKLIYPGYVDGLGPSVLRSMIAEAERTIPKFNKHFKAVQGYFDALREITVLSGEKTRAEMERIQKYDDYVPIPTALRERGVTGRQYPEPTAGLRKARGHTDPNARLLDVAESDTRSTLQAYYGNLNRLRTVDRLTSTANDAALPWDARTMAGRAAVKIGVKPDVVARLKPAEMAEVVANYLNSKTGATPETGGVRPEQINISQDATEIWRGGPPKDVNVIRVFRDGVPEYWQIKDPMLWHMFTYTDRPGDIMRFVDAVASPMTRVWKPRVTQSLPFAIHNMQRDIWNTMMLGRGMQAYIPAANHLMGFFNQITGMYPDARRVTEMLSRSLQQDDRTMAKRMTTDRMWNWMQEGWYDSKLPNKKLRYLVNTLHPANILNAALKPVDVVNFMTGGRIIAPWGEGLAREGAYVWEKVRGRSDEDAIRAYENISGLYVERSGFENLKAVARWPGFLNPMLQVNNRHFFDFTDPDPGVRASKLAKLGWIGTITAAMWAMNRAFMTPEQEEEYDRVNAERPTEDRARYFMVGPWNLRMSMAYGPEGSVQSLVWNTLDEMVAGTPIQKRPEFYRHVAKRIGEMPMNISAWFPPMFRSIDEAKSNYVWYFDNHIESPWMANLPPDQRFYDHTPKFYRKLGEWANYSPLQIQHMVQAGMGWQIDEMIRVLDRVERGQSIIQERADIPFAGRLFVRDPVGFRAESVRTLGEIDEQVKALWRRVGHLDPAVDNPHRKEIVAMTRPELYEQFQALEVLEAGMNSIMQMQQAIKQLQRTGGYDSEIRNIRQQMVGVAQQSLAASPKAFENIERANQYIRSLTEFYPSDMD